jgi:hypothetical protein
MSGINGEMAIVVLAIFLIGIAIGFVITLAVASRREDKCRSLTGPAPDFTTGGARRAFGLGLGKLTRLPDAWQASGAPQDREFPRDPEDPQAPDPEAFAFDGQGRHR